MKNEKKGRGAPTKYKEEYCHSLLVSARREETIESFCADIGIHKDTFYEWCKVHSDFSDAHKEAMTIRQALFLARTHNCAFKPDKNPCNNGMAYLYAHAIGVRIKPDEKEDTGNSELAEALREAISSKQG